MLQLEIADQVLIAKVHLIHIEDRIYEQEAGPVQSNIEQDFWISLLFESIFEVAQSHEFKLKSCR